jgi:hypothetical protein
MKIRMKIADKDVLLSVAQYEAILEVLLNADEMKDKYMGTGKGENGTNYVRIIKPLDITDDLHVRTMPDGEYEAIMLKCKLNPDLLT